MNANGSQEKLEDLSQEQLVALLRSTYEYKTFADYYDQHDLTFLDKVAGLKDCPSPSPCSEQTILKELESLNQEEGLGLHKYHEDLIFNIFKNYYWAHEQEQIQTLNHKYELLMNRAEKEAERSLPRELEEVCAEKERELARQVKKKRNKTVKMWMKQN